MRHIIGEISAMNDLNSLLNQQQSSYLQEIHNHGHSDPVSSHDDFLEQMLSSVPSSAAASFPWADEQPSALLGHLGEQSAAVLASKMRQHQISNAANNALMFQQQLLLSRSLSASNDLCSRTEADAGLLPMPQGDNNDVVDCRSFQENDASTKALFNGFSGLHGQTSNQPHHFHQSQPENFGVAAAAPALSQAAANGSGGGGVAGQPRQKVRARRGQATDPHSIAERLRRERIAGRMKALQELVPNANKTDKASMLDEIIDYVKFLQLQVKVLSMSRLGGAAAVAPLLGDASSLGKSGNAAETASSSQNDEGMAVAEQQVAKLMEDDMGAAMQYLQGKGLCLMPISLASAISTTTCRSRNTIPLPNNPLLNCEAGGPTSPSMSVLTVQSATIGGGTGGGESFLKDATSVSKP